MKNAFTLAEVLITLGIIGIVSAMTIPNLISKHNKRTVETRLFKIHSTILQATRMAQANNYDDINIVIGAGFSWEKSKALFEEYFSPVFKVIHQYPKEKTFKVYSADGSTEVSPIDSNSFIVVLSDGTVLGFTNAVYGAFYVDVILNPNRKKLISGRDTFFMKYTTDGYGNISYQTLLQYDKNSYKTYCTSHEQRPALAIYPSYFCTALIFKNNFKIPDDYPVKL